MFGRDSLNRWPIVGLLMFASSCSAATGAGSGARSVAPSAASERSVAPSATTQRSVAPSVKPLTRLEEQLVGTWSRYHRFDGSSDFLVFDVDRTGCGWKEPAGGGRGDESAYRHWELDEANPIRANRYPINVNGSPGRHVFNYAEREIWLGGYDNLRMSQSRTNEYCTASGGGGSAARTNPPAPRDRTITVDADARAAFVALRAAGGQVDARVPVGFTQTLSIPGSAGGSATVTGQKTSTRSSSTSSTFSSSTSDFTIAFSDFRSGTTSISGRVKWYDSSSSRTACTSTGSCATASSRSEAIHGTVVAIKFEFAGAGFVDEITIDADSAGDTTTWNVKLTTKDGKTFSLSRV